MTDTRSRYLPALVAALLWLAAGVVHAQPVPAPPAPTDDAQSLLARSDMVRNPRRAFRVNVELFEYRKGALANSMRLNVFARPDQHTGRFGNLIRFEKPAKDVNKLMLFQGKDLWFYDPKSHSSFRLSPQQRLVGQAANGDVVTTSFSRDYTARLEGVETIGDGDKIQRSCNRLSLTAAGAEATYARIEFWQEATSAQPIKAQFYSQSGQLLKTAFFRKYAAQLGIDRPTEVVIIDGLNSQLVTVMRYSDYEYHEVPASWMQRDYLPRFRLP